MKNFVKKNWRLLYGAYVFIYLPWFFILEKLITPDYPGLHIINTAIDDAIPFCEYFIIPYVLWFFYVIGSCIFMLFKANDSEFIKFGLSLVIGMSICLIICMIYPSGLTLRPDHISDDFCGKMIQWLYSTDTSTNVFPSIHVYNSLIIQIALNRCQALNKHRIIRLSSSVLCILICLSTIFLKQHSLYDVIGACVLTVIMYIAIYVFDIEKIFKKNKNNEPQMTE